ncbi:hypothetical protein GALMADRAFT_249334 [Galerina marginata CBS 339.88]|uniref:Mtf2-like C-terminal domain-containing protein n=1 Tax=Galerina marginata (strain CBS 339.88) TaxID=685588 RepID=A0A067SZ05_GALM3|nr:hypothetical protein GALMADRAFT_249334 [Galerina marginata CBS 339.88]
MLSRSRLSSHFSKTLASRVYISPCLCFIRTAASSATLPVKWTSRISKSRPTSFCFSNSAPRRTFAGGRQATDGVRPSKQTLNETGSLWSEESWDQVFDDLDKSLPPARQPPNIFSQSPARRQTMTERESKVLTGMLDMIFESKEAREELGTKKPAEGSNEEGGIARGQVDDLFSRLRQYSRRSRKVDPSTELLDKKKEEMSLCTTDQQLLEWASLEVFDESKRYEEAAKSAMAEAAQTGNKSELPHLQSPIYPQLIAHLMRTFRVQFRDPNLSLFIFNHAQKLSTVSYVFGCSTAAYNELIETRWMSFRDLEGVHTAIQEMVINGVPIDNRTQKVVDLVRRELGNQEILVDHSEDTQAESWDTLNKIERLMSPNQQARSRRNGFHQWKSEGEDEDTFDDWSFDQLDRFARRTRPPTRDQSFRKL